MAGWKLSNTFDLGGTGPIGDEQDSYGRNNPEPKSAWYPGKELGALANRGLEWAANSAPGRSISSALTDINSGLDTFKDSRVGQMWGGAAKGMAGWERAKAGYGPASGLGYGQGGGGDLASMIQNLSAEELAMLRAMLQGGGTANDAGEVKVIDDGGL